MKKFLLLGACVASIAVSSSAFAAVNYGEETGLTISVNEAENAVSVTEGLPTEGQATVLVVKGNNPATIVQGDILFIDQDAAGTATFAKDMGLLLKAEDGSALEKLPAGTYTVKVGGDKVTAIAVKTFTVSDSAAGDDYVALTGIYGDVNGDGSINATDSTSLLNALVAGGSNQPGKCAYVLGTKLAIKDSDAILVWGDYDGNKTVNTTDSTSLLNALVASGATKSGNSAYSFGDNFADLNVQVKVVTE